MLLFGFYGDLDEAMVIERNDNDDSHANMDAYANPISWAYAGLSITHPSFHVNIHTYLYSHTQYSAHGYTHPILPTYIYTDKHPYPNHYGYIHANTHRHEYIFADQPTSHTNTFGYTRDSLNTPIMTF